MGIGILISTSGGIKPFQFFTFNSTGILSSLKFIVVKFYSNLFLKQDVWYYIYINHSFDLFHNCRFRFFRYRGPWPNTRADLMCNTCNVLYH